MKLIDRLIEYYQLNRVGKDPLFISEIQNPSEKIQMLAVKKDLGVITLIDKPCEAVQIYAAEQDPFSVSLYESSEAARMVAIEKDPQVIVNIEKPSPHLCKFALEKEFSGSLAKNNLTPLETQNLFKEIKGVETVEERINIFESVRSKIHDSGRLHVEAIKILQGNAPEQIFEEKFERIRIEFPNENEQLHEGIYDMESGKIYNESRLMSDSHWKKIQIKTSAQYFADNIKNSLTPEELLDYSKELRSTSSLPLSEKKATREETFNLFSHHFKIEKFKTAIFENETTGQYEIHSPIIKYQNQGDTILRAGTHPYSSNYKEIFLKAGLVDEYNAFEKACCERSKWEHNYNYAIQSHDIVEIDNLEKKLPIIDKKVENSRAAVFNKFNALYFNTEKWQELCHTDTKRLIWDVKDGNITETIITDKLTGGSTILDTNGIDLRDFKPSQLNDLLSNKKIDHFDSAGNFLGKLGLSKTPAGWGLSIGKQVVSLADSEAGI